MYVKIENNEVVQYPYTVQQFRADNKNISFPLDITNEMLASHGIYPVIKDTAPTYDAATQRLVESNTPVLREGKWVLTKSIQQLTPGQIESYRITIAKKVRSTRTELLQKTDWCACSDVTMSAEMATYRQALRDVPAQEGFPYNITWPTKPA